MGSGYRPAVGTRWIVLSLSIAAASLYSGNGPVAAQSTQYVGTTPCDDAVRTFVGGLPAATACHTITWRLSLSGDGKWTLGAMYGVPAASNPNVVVDGPTVKLEGAL